VRNVKAAVVASTKVMNHYYNTGIVTGNTTATVTATEPVVL